MTPEQNYENFKSIYSSAKFKFNAVLQARKLVSKISHYVDNCKDETKLPKLKTDLENSVQRLKENRDILKEKLLMFKYK